MDKWKLVLALAVLLLLFNPVQAIVVTDPTPQDTSVKTNAELIARIQSLETKIGALPTKEDVTTTLQAHLVLVNQIMDNFRSMLIVSFIIIGAALLGLGYSVYFFFKGQGRL